MIKEGLDRFEIGLDEVKTVGLNRLMGYVEYWLIRLALKRANGNTTEAARLLRIQRTTLAMKRKKYGLPMGKEKEIGH